MYEYIVRYKDMPCTVSGFFKEDANGDYNIYINSRLNYEQQRDALRHEIYHIKHADLESDLPLSTLEHRAG